MILLQITLELTTRGGNCSKSSRNTIISFHCAIFSRKVIHYILNTQKNSHLHMVWLLCLCKAFMWVKVEEKKSLSDHMSWFGDSKNMVLVYTGQPLAIDRQKNYLDWLWIWGRAPLLLQNISLVTFWCLKSH